MERTARTRRIMVVDDDPEIGELLGLMIHQLGYAVDVYSDPGLALTELARKTYWALFCDYSMPGMSGEHVFEEVRVALPELARRFVLVTGMDIAGHPLAFARTAGVLTLKKPFVLADVQRVLAQW